MAQLVVADGRATEAVTTDRERLAQESRKHAGLCRMSADQRAELAAHCDPFLSLPAQRFPLLSYGKSAEIGVTSAGA